MWEGEREGGEEMRERETERQFPLSADEQFILTRKTNTKQT